MQNSVNLESLDLKVRIGTILFDVVLESNLEQKDDVIYAKKHNHSSYEIHFILHGRGKLIIDQREVELRQNSCLVIEPGIYHSIWQDVKSPLFKYHLKLTYDSIKDGSSSHLENEFSHIKTLLSEQKYIYLKDAQNNITLIQEILCEWEKKSVGYYAVIQNLVAKIIINLIRSVINGDEKETIYTAPQKSKDNQRSLLIEDFFEDYRNDLKIEQLANLLNLSNKQVNRIMKKMYNTTFKQKLIDVRIEVAKDLLRDRSLSVESISEKVGYSDKNNFYTAFKKRTGLCPFEYRERVCNNI